MSSPVNTISKFVPPVQAVISLGSNLSYSPRQPHEPDLAHSPHGSVKSPIELLKLSLYELQKLSECSLTISSLYQTAAVDSPPGAPDFVNAAVLLTVADGTDALQLLRQLQAIENQFGRTRSELANTPRTLDLDLISFGAQQCHVPDLILPHPRAHTRAFVMVPLAEIAPHYVLPGQQLTAAQLARDLVSAQPDPVGIKRVSL